MNWSFSNGAITKTIITLWFQGTVFGFTASLHTNRQLSSSLFSIMCRTLVEEEASGWSDDLTLNNSLLKTRIGQLKHVKGILFDVDGTLADSWKLGFDATQIVLENNNIPKITERVYHEGTRYSTPHRLALHAGICPEAEPEKFKVVGEKLAEQFDAYYVGLVSKETAGYYDGIHDFLRAIPDHVQMGALTNACVAYAHAVLKINDETFYTRFATVHGADTAAKPKPNPDGLLLCCQELGLNPENCVYIGDSPSDGAAAHAAGMPAIGVTWGSHPIQSLKNAPFVHLCSNVSELRALLPQT